MNEKELEEARLSCEQIIDRVAEAFVGNRLLLRKLLAAALANGHVLFEEAPSAFSSRRTCSHLTSWG